MARRCFEVSKIVFTFCCTNDQDGKKKLVSERMDKYLRKYASNIRYKIFCDTCEDCDANTVIQVELSNCIALNTMNTILSHMFGEKVSCLNYTQSEKLLNLKIL